MKPNRIALALVLAGLAAPAFAEKCVGSCDFNDEPLVVKGDKKQTGAEQPAASKTGLPVSSPSLTPGKIATRIAPAALPQASHVKVFDGYTKIEQVAPALKGAATVGPATRR